MGRSATKVKRSPVVILVALYALIIAGCGGSDGPLRSTSELPGDFTPLPGPAISSPTAQPVEGSDPIPATVEDGTSTVVPRPLEGDVNLLSKEMVSPFVLPGATGSEHSLVEYLEKGKVVLVFYRAFW